MRRVHGRYSHEVRERSSHEPTKRSCHLIASGSVRLVQGRYRDVNDRCSRYHIWYPIARPCLNGALGATARPLGGGLFKIFQRSHAKRCSSRSSLKVAGSSRLAMCPAFLSTRSETAGSPSATRRAMI